MILKELLTSLGIAISADVIKSQVMAYGKKNSNKFGLGALALAVVAGAVLGSFLPDKYNPKELFKKKV